MFKLVPPSQDVSICLRCQYRLSVRQGSHSGHRRLTGYPQQLRRFTLGASLQQQPASIHHDEIKSDYLGRAPIGLWTEEPLPNQYYRPIIWPPDYDYDRLGFHVLGEPAEVLILRDKQGRWKLHYKVRPSDPDKNPDPEPSSSSELLEKIDTGRGKIKFKEACKNIESVRALLAANTNGGINQDEYSDLVSRLQVGFTREQLVAYLGRFRQDRTDGHFNLHFRLSSALYARSSWQVLGSTLPGTVRVPPLQKRDKEVLEREGGSRLRKDALAKMIIRHCWDIKPNSLDSSLGELDLRFQSIHFSLILNHKRDILKLMSQSYDSKVEAWPKAKIIRITADYDSCVDIVKLLLHTVKNIKTSKLDLDVNLLSHRDSKLPQTELDMVTRQQIERYTNTLVRPSHQRLVVHYLGPDDTDLIETQRVIHQMLRPGSTQVPQLAWSKRDNPTVDYLLPVVVGSRLSILSRKRHWSRWTSTQGGDLSGNTKKKDHSDLDSKKSNYGEDVRVHNGKPLSRSSTYEMTHAMRRTMTFDPVKLFFVKPDNTTYKTRSTNTPYWTKEIEYHDSATFGQVLFPAANEKLDNQRKTKIDFRDMDKKSLKKSIKETSRERREFVPLVPGLLKTLESIRPLKKSEEYVKGEEYLQVRLSPSSKNMSLPVPLKALPDLEIKILLDDKNKAVSIKNVRLVTRIAKDYLQPQSVVDLRFIREQCVYANAKVDPCITTFVGNSNFNIWGTERLTTPLDLSLSIPALAVQSHRGFDPKAHKSLLVDYTSLGLDHRSSLTFHYQDIDSWPMLSYTSVEAGGIGGRRDELSLHSHRFVSQQRQPQRQPPTTSTIPLHPLSSSSSSSSAPAVGTKTQTLSEDDHAAIFFYKTAALVKSIEHSGPEGSPSRMMPQFPEVQRWRKFVMKDVVRRVAL